MGRYPRPVRARNYHKIRYLVEFQVTKYLKVLNLYRLNTQRASSSAVEAQISAHSLGRGGVRVVSKRSAVLTEPRVLPANGGVTDGARTRDLRSHNPMLYQLS